ncbi:helix-turn-helix domain-containing protein [Pseudomarimonas arenosa]|uniref:AraC family transcriptional regulator n=1 Tax=Pseudomarimonas arenosa TaxID=2774145 RepID=A0AAW3ZVM5_9GAMM|nr:helix-turn-helix domain-containing protein [Pseudomarimonas arenosa]MBD8528337.1 AraC family transcriptional regulator [Pseudomarimonas arenosa]
MSLLIHLLLAVGFAQGLMLCWQLWRLRQRNPYGYLHLLIALSAVLLVLLEQWLVQAGAWRDWPHLLRATVWMPFLFGPGLWLFVRSLDSPRPRRIDWLHYLPALLALCWFLPFLLQSGAAKRDFVEHTVSIPLESTVFGLGKAVSMFAYLLALRCRLRRAAEGDRLRRNFARATDVFLGFLVLLWLHFLFGHRWGEWGLPTDLIAALGLALFFYAASLIATSHWRDFALSLAPTTPPQDAAPAPAASTTSIVAAREPRLDGEQTAQLYPQVREEVLARGLFREPGLKVDQLADQLGLKTHYLSFLINAGSGRNVQAWLNGLRVEAAKQALSAGNADSILEIGLAAGFNSKASFNRAFKAATGQSPSEYAASATSQIRN